jgi:hypothetical protein
MPSTCESKSLLYLNQAGHSSSALSGRLQTEFTFIARAIFKTTETGLAGRDGGVSIDAAIFGGEQARQRPHDLPGRCSHPIGPTREAR